ncbi:MAG: hypothetical protein BWY74_03751 [Firmicutes bacterium ADurb.Bin419]|nr:MAG: hypothetical protein BWY74_03751 [Firmicutes bacterium ADurb.Bin419]
MISYVKPQKINIKSHSELNEKWVQEVIANDPSIIGLGDLILKDKERIQPLAGRLDLLLQNEDATKRYEVEIQLGKTDESHIIRTIEYWDIERKRFPQYEHCAVIIAEDITSRFLNVISLFNGAIPLIAIQMNAIRVGDSTSLIFTTVLNQLTLGLVDEDEEVAEVTDRTYWEQMRGTKQTVSMADDVLELIKTLSPSFELKYNKFYIGLADNGQPNNFVIFRPQRNIMRFEIRIPKSDHLENKIESVGLDMLDYDDRWGRYRIKLNKEDIKKNKDFIIELLKIAYEK